MATFAASVHYVASVAVVRKDFFPSNDHHGFSTTDLIVTTEDGKEVIFTLYSKRPITVGADQPEEVAA